MFNFAIFSGQIQTRVFFWGDDGKPKCPKYPKKGGGHKVPWGEHPFETDDWSLTRFHDQEGKEKWPKEGREQHPFNYSMVRKGAEKKRTTGWSRSSRGKNSLNLSILNPIYVCTRCFEIEYVFAWSLFWKCLKGFHSYIFVTMNHCDQTNVFLSLSRSFLGWKILILIEKWKVMIGVKTWWWELLTIIGDADFDRKVKTNN